MDFIFAGQCPILQCTRNYELTSLLAAIGKKWQNQSARLLVKKLKLALLCNALTVFWKSDLKKGRKNTPGFQPIADMLMSVQYSDIFMSIANWLPATLLHGISQQKLK